MQDFYAVHFVYAMTEISKAILAIQTSIGLVGDRDPEPPDSLYHVLLKAQSEKFESETQSTPEWVSAVLEFAAPSLHTLPLSRAVMGMFDRLRKDLREDGNNLTKVVILTRLTTLREAIMDDFKAQHFLLIDEGRSEFYVQKEPPFGQGVQDAFPEAGIDINAAARCFALDEFTACVFHLMRVLEHGLRWFAHGVGLEEAEYEGENWKNVIDRIEKVIRGLEQQKKSPVKTANTKALSEAALQFRLFKDAFRNHVAHALQNYDENSAKTVWDGVMHFMQTLAKPDFPSLKNNP